MDSDVEAVANRIMLFLAVPPGFIHPPT